MTADEYDALAGGDSGVRRVPVTAVNDGRDADRESVGRATDTRPLRAFGTAVRTHSPISEAILHD